MNTTKRKRIQKNRMLKRSVVSKDAMNKLREAIKELGYDMVVDKDGFFHLDVN